MRRLLLLLVACLALPVVAQSKHPFTFEDLMALKRVGEPEVSPNGKWVIFSAVDVNLQANTKTPHIWIVPLAGGPERQIISDQSADRPRWSPDGNRFAFTSTKEGGSQIWIADFDDAAGTVTGVHKLTSIATEASGELWSPDGTNIAFTSDVYPECDGPPAAEQACNAKKLNEAATSKVKAQIFTHLLYRHWNAYREGKRTHILVVSADGGAARDLTPGDYDAPVFSLGGQDDYALSPDGKELCYTSNHDKNPAASTNNDLWIVPVNFEADASPTQVVSQTKNITSDNPASDSSPLYSPDGKYIAYRAQKRPGYESDRFRLMVYDRKTGEKKNYTETFENWVDTFIWAPNSRRIYFSSEIEGVAPIFKLDLTAPVPKPVFTKQDANGYSDNMAVTNDGKLMVFTRMSLQFPNEIAKLDLSSEGGVQFLTHINDTVLSQVSMSPIEPFWFMGAHDQKVEGFLLKPPNFDPNQKYPLKFIVHGGPEVPVGDEWSYRWNSELFAASGYVVIEINFHGSPGYGQKFTDAINGDWGGAPFEDLMKGLDYAEQHYPFIDSERECALGASYGGYMMNWILGHTDRFKCIVTHDGMFNAESAWGTTEELWFNDWEFKGTPYTNRALYQKWSPHQYENNFKTPTLVIHGQLDYRLDVSEGFQLFTTLQMRGVPSKMLYFPDEGHWVLKPQNSQLWYKTVNDWVDQWTKK
jgi:dipeptidyl aminopeptidase/acylaminoacyl peptidase